jgi:tetratricopeptide (TPR) repeat protein
MKWLLFIALAALPLFGQTTRIASDFEITQMQQQLAKSHDFLSQLSGRLNLGDVLASRGEGTQARREYAKAYEIATAGRLDARRASDMTRYATATSYAALAQAKLSSAGPAYELAEEAIRYESGSAKTWNLYANTMSLLGKPAKAASASRNAVAIGQRELAQSPDPGNRLDLAIYQYALASALIDSGRAREAEPLLVEVTSSLRSPAFDSIRREVVRRESFEIYSSARGEASSYISLLNRSQLRLAALYETRGDMAAARRQYENVLAARSDDPTALTGLARLSQSGDHSGDHFGDHSGDHFGDPYNDAFDANPFSVALIRDYRRFLDTHPGEPADGDSTGARMRRFLIAEHRHEPHAARTTLDQLQRDYPENDTLHALRSQLDGQSAVVPEFLKTGVTAARPTGDELRSLLLLFDEDNLTAEQRSALDTLVLTSNASFEDAKGGGAEGQTVFETGSINGVAFRFSEPIAFRGMFAAHTPVRLTYHVLGASSDALLIEPLKLEAAP